MVNKMTVAPWAYKILAIILWSPIQPYSDDVLFNIAPNPLLLLMQLYGN